MITSAFPSTAPMMMDPKIKLFMHRTLTSMARSLEVSSVGPMVARSVMTVLASEDVPLGFPMVADDKLVTTVESSVATIVTGPGTCSTPASIALRAINAS